MSSDAYIRMYVSVIKHCNYACSDWWIILPFSSSLIWQLNAIMSLIKSQMYPISFIEESVRSVSSIWLIYSWIVTSIETLMKWRLTWQVLVSWSNARKNAWVLFYSLLYLQLVTLQWNLSNPVTSGLKISDLIKQVAALYSTPLLQKLQQFFMICIFDPVYSCIACIVVCQKVPVGLKWRIKPYSLLSPRASGKFH